jgi:FolB domain-containing protein
MDFILIEDLFLDCIVGVRPYERRRAQPVRLALWLGLDLSGAARSGRISHTCDYDRVTDEVRSLLRFREYRLLEVATEELAAMLFAVHPPLLQVDIRLDKPAALHGRARSAGVRVSRLRSEFPAQRVATDFGAVERWWHTDEASLSLWHVRAGAGVRIDAGACKTLLRWVVEGELQAAERILSAGDPISAASNLPLELFNAGAAGATVFCCDCR